MYREKRMKERKKYLCIEEQTKGRGITPSSTFLDGEITDVWFTRLNNTCMLLTHHVSSTCCINHYSGDTLYTIWRNVQLTTAQLWRGKERVTIWWSACNWDNHTKVEITISFLLWGMHLGGGIPWALPMHTSGFRCISINPSSKAYSAETLTETHLLIHNLWHTAQVDQRDRQGYKSVVSLWSRVTTSCIPGVGTNKHLLGFCFQNTFSKGRVVMPQNSW